MDSGYQIFHDRLSASARGALEDQGGDKSDWPDERQPAYCLVICPDGSTPTVQTFYTSDELADFLKNVDGDDTYVFPFLGIPLPFTEAPTRVLFLPDNTAVPINAEGRVAIAHAGDADGVVIQDDYFMGAPELILKSARDEDLALQEDPPESVEDDFADG